MEVNMEKILIVEDEKDTADAMAKFLTRKGFDVEIAYDLPSALNRFLAYYKIVLLDILLKGEKSFPVLKKIKAENPETFVVVVTAYDNDENIAEAKKLGADGFITKPIMSEHLEAFLLSKIHSLHKKQPEK
jgi:DNA-binding response OmpR family regulator